MIPYTIEEANMPPRPTWMERFDPVAHALEMLNAETERWLRKAIKAGRGWRLYRSHPEAKDGDPFVIVHRFKLIAPGEATLPGAGVVFTPPDLTDGERIRLLAGRYDWREDKWEDDCGVDDCGHPSCERNR